MLRRQPRLRAGSREPADRALQPSHRSVLESLQPGIRRSHAGRALSAATAIAQRSTASGTSATTTLCARSTRASTKPSCCAAVRSGSSPTRPRATRTSTRGCGSTASVDASRATPTDILTDRAIEFLGRDDERPFFLYLPFNTPHNPLQAPDELWQPYAQQDLSSEAFPVARSQAAAQAQDRRHSTRLRNDRVDRREPGALVRAA